MEGLKCELVLLRSNLGLEGIHILRSCEDFAVASRKEDHLKARLIGEFQPLPRRVTSMDLDGIDPKIGELLQISTIILPALLHPYCQKRTGFSVQGQLTRTVAEISNSSASNMTVDWTFVGIKKGC